MFNLKKFKRDFQQSSYYKKLFSYEPVVFIYISGSRAIDNKKMLNKKSDIDIIVAHDYKEAFPYEADEYLLYKKKYKVHWYFVPFFNYYISNSAQSNYKTLSAMGLATFHFIQDKFILYKNPNYIDDINKLLLNKDKISHYWAEIFYSRCQNLVTDILKENTINQQCYTKLIGHLCLLSYDLLNEPIDGTFIREIKQIRHKKVPKKYVMQAVERIKLLKQYYDNENNKTV